MLWFVLSVATFFSLYWWTDYFADPMILVRQAVEAVRGPTWHSVEPLVPGLLFVLLLIVTIRSANRWTHRADEKKRIEWVLKDLEEDL